MQRVKVTLVMVEAQLIIAVFSVSYNLAADDGMHMSVLIAYRYLFFHFCSSYCFAFIIERNKRPKLTILFQAFLCAIFWGPLSQNLYAKSLVLTSTSFAAAFTNLIPPFTFIVALLLGKAKVIGTIVSVRGAMLLTFYKGQQLNIWSTHFNILNGGQHMNGHVTTVHTTSDHIVGCVITLTSSLAVALYLTLQGTTSVGAIFLVMAVVHLQGPLFASIFNPLLLEFVAITGFLVLNEKLYIGSVLGSVVIVIRLYVVLWGKSKETKLSSSGSSKDRNDVSNTTTNTMNLKSSSIARAFDEGDELLVYSQRGNYEG